MVRIFTEHWPFVIAIVAGDLDDADFDYMYEQYRSIHLRDQRFFLVQETRKVKLPNADTRKKLAKLNSDFADDIKQHVTGIGVVVASKVFAGAMRAVYWLSGENSPTTYWSSAADCFEEAERRAKLERMILPASAKSFAEELDSQLKDARDFSKYF